MKKILIVDDLRPFVEEQKNILSRSDVHIFTATLGSEAFAIHKNVKVDLIIADLNMPEMAGDELCSKIRSDPELKYVSILMVTRPREADVERCKNCGANDYITKPIKPEVLIDKATALLGVATRKSYRVFVNATIKGEKGQANFTANSINISSGGILIEAKQELNIGDRVNCAFYLPGAATINIVGEIVRKTRKPIEDMFRYGVKFIEVSNDTRKTIDEFVKTHHTLGQ